MNIPASFERTSFRKRGHFSNHFTLNPVLRLEFGPSSLTVVRKRGTFDHPYHTLSAEILKTYAYKPYGGGAGSYIPQTLVSIHSNGASFSFDVSNQFPDFKNGKEILELIEQNISVTHKKHALKEVKRRKNFIGIAVLIVILALFWLFHLLGYW
jgi:hypothetical protein